jgi:hypothetical protein
MPNNEVTGMRQYGKNRRIITAVILVLATMILSITNYTKVFMGNDETTRDLYGNSVSLVHDMIAMRYQNQDGMQYGLGYLSPYNGAYESGLTDEELKVNAGYGTEEKILVVSNNEMTRLEYEEGNTLIFMSGDKAKVTGNYVQGDYLFVEYEADEIYSFGGQGELKYVCVYNNDEDTYIQIGESEPYESQLGLQGKLLCALPKSLNMHEVIVFGKVTLAILFAIIMTLICYGVAIKYNRLFGILFYMVTLLSPWMIGFSTNLYWVEFTWFLPMLIGLICANHLENRKVRIFSYVGMILAIAVKSACGYEYISTVMLGGIVFLLADLTCALMEHRDKRKIKRLFSTVFSLGVSALLGFGIALISHAYLRGGGVIYKGLRSIYYNDILRRTYGDASMFQDVYADSLNASVFRVVAHYLFFKTPLILGVTKWAFLPLIAITFILLTHGIIKKQIDKKYMVLFIWLGITAISWFVLGKAHSYIHTSMNYVMWYFGFMQFIFYVPVQAIVQCVKRHREKRG